MCFYILEFWNSTKQCAHNSAKKVWNCLWLLKKSVDSCVILQQKVWNHISTSTKLHYELCRTTNFFQFVFSHCVKFHFKLSYFYIHLYTLLKIKNHFCVVLHLLTFQNSCLKASKTTGFELQGHWIWVVRLLGLSCDFAKYKIFYMDNKIFLNNKKLYFAGLYVVLCVGLYINLTQYIVLF